MKKIYEIDKVETLQGIRYVSDAIIKRLYASFDTMEEESKAVEEKACKRFSKMFNPDTMDESYFLEEAFHEGMNYYIIHERMKQEFLNSSLVWIFHQFEKDCDRIFKNKKGNEKKLILEKLNIDTSKNSLWAKCNTELRVLANTIKHGEGSSAEQLKVLRPDFFKKNFAGLSYISVVASIKDIELYVESLLGFWGEFFDAALPEYAS